MSESDVRAEEAKANLWVIMTGLGVLVESTTDYAVLMRRALPSEVVGGKNVLPHEPTLLAKPGGIPMLVSGREIEFLPRGTERPKLRDEDRNLLIPLGRKLATPAKIRDAILRDKFEGTKILLADGSLEGIHIDNNYLLDKVSRDIGITLVGIFEPDQNSRVGVEARAIANGLLYRRQIMSSEGSPSLRIGDEELPLASVAKEAMGNLREDDGNKDYVIWIVNVASEGFSDPDPDLDRDFYLLYDWLAEELEEHYVPITEKRRARDTGQGNPPGQCVYGYTIS
jgi:hypothetical protein